MSCLLLPTKDVCIHFFTFVSLSYCVIQLVSPQFSFEFPSLLFWRYMFALPGARLILSPFLLYLSFFQLLRARNRRKKESISLNLDGLMVDPIGFPLVDQEQRSGLRILRRSSLLGYQQCNSSFQTWSDDQGRSYRSAQGDQLNCQTERSFQTQ